MKDKHTKDLFKVTMQTMPEGYYSGDKLNHNLRAFVVQHIKERPYDPAIDDYNVPAFKEPITIDKRKSESMDLHIYWSKKPHDAIRQYIRHYTQPGDLVLDPFCGSGGTALAALMEGRKAIAIDRSPAATFITKNYCTPVNVQELQKAFEELKRQINPEINFLYETRCDRCGGNATTAYTVYSQVFQCPRCMEKVPLFDCVDEESRTPQGKTKTITMCPHCHCKGVNEIISTRAEKFGAVPVLVSYFCKDGCKPVRGERRHNDADPRKRGYFEQFDLAKIREIEAKPIPHWYPTIEMIKGRETCVKRNLAAQGVRTVADLFTKRNLWALATIRDACVNSAARDFLLFVLDTAILTVSRMCRHDYPSVMAGTYYVPPINRELNVWENFLGRLPRKIKGILAIADSIETQKLFLMVSTQSATSIKQIETSSIDYIFTDPPYADKVQYGELNFIWEAWLGLDTHWHDEEIIVNEVRGKTEEDWTNMMRQAMAECFRVLKPGRWLSLCYHDTSEGTWALVQQIMTEMGFIPDATDSALFIDTGQKSYNQITADKVTKRDLIINFRKPKPGEGRLTVFSDGCEDDRSFREKVRLIIRDFLEKNPGSTKDRIYDELVSRMVRKGEMEAHDFEAVLRDVAEIVRQPVRKILLENEPPNLLGTHQMACWYLKETETGAEKVEQVTADSAAAQIHDFLRRTTTSRRLESESEIVRRTADQARIRERSQAVDQGMIAESRGKLIRDLREFSDRLEKLEAQRAEWQLQALHYSDIFEFYVTGVNPKPKAMLEELLEDYCYQTDAGNWRPPLTDEEKTEKSSERQRAVRSQIQRFYKLLESGQAVPESLRRDTVTLVEWIRHCRRTGLHAQGKLLYEQGGLDLNALSEQDQVNVEEDYQVCVRALQHR